MRPKDNEHVESTRLEKQFGKVRRGMKRIAGKEYEAIEGSLMYLKMFLLVIRIAGATDVNFIAYHWGLTVSTTSFLD